jgi:hypothetical protein
LAARKTARDLGSGRITLFDKMKRLGLLGGFR